MLDGQVVTAKQAAALLGISEARLATMAVSWGIERVGDGYRLDHVLIRRDKMRGLVV